MKRVLITGGLGYLAGRIAEHLSAAGWAVILSGRAMRAEAARWAERFEFRACDVLTPAAHPGVLEGVDAVVHLASLDEREAEREPLRALAVSGEGTRLLLAALRDQPRVRFVFFSTFHVYGPLAPASIDEETPTRPTHPYAIAHLAGECFCLQARLRGQDVAVLRPSNGYGAPSWAAVDRWTLAHNDFAKQAVESKRIVLQSSGEQHRDFVSSTDVAQACELTLVAPREALAPGTFNVGGRSSLSIYEVALRVQARARAVLGIECPIERPAPTRAGSKVDLSIERMVSLGYQPKDRFDEETDRIFALLGAV